MIFARYTNVLARLPGKLGRGNVGKKEVELLRKLIKDRYNLLQKVRTAKGKRLEGLQMEIGALNHRIAQLDEKQK